MTDFVGPASSLNAVTTRPSDGRQWGSLLTWFKNCTNSNTQDGTEVDAAWLNQVTGFFRNLIGANGTKADGVTPVVPVDQSDNMVLSAVLQLIQRGQANYAVDTGTADALLVAPSVALAEYKAGMRLLVLKNPGVGANATTTPTINISGLGNLTIVKDDASPLVAGDLKKAGLFEIELDGAGNARLTALLTISDVLALIQANGNVCVVYNGGTANAITGLGAPAVNAYRQGQLYLVATVGLNNSGPVTMAVGGLAAKPVTTRAGAALQASDIPGNSVFACMDVGSSFEMIGPVSSEILALIAANQIGIQNPLAAVTAPGTYTYTPSSSRVRAILVKGQAPGGGGSASSNTTSGQMSVGMPGSAGGYFEYYVAIPTGYTANYVVGAPGAGGPSAAGVGYAAGNGTTTVWNGVAFAYGGQGGPATSPVATPAYSNTAAVSGGTASGGNLVNRPGGASQASEYLYSTAYAGQGGNSQNGSSGVAYAVTSTGSVGVGYGSGGTPGVTQPNASAQNGGAGAPGFIQITEIF